MKRTFIGAAALTLAGCASYSGVVPAGDDTFMITKQAATGLSGLGNMKAEVLQDAAAHCTKSQQTMSVVSYDETKGPYLFGKYPRVDLTFRCVAKPG